MASLPSAATGYIWSANCLLSDDTDNLVCLKNVTVRWSYIVMEETVVGTDVPVQGAGEFRGTIEYDMLNNTELGHHDRLTKTSGQLTAHDYVLSEVDNAGTQVTRTWTINARINQFQTVVRENDFSRVRCAGVLTARPTEEVA